MAYPAFTCPLLYKTNPAPIKVKIINITLNIKAAFFMVSSLSIPICPFDYTTFIPYLLQKIQGIAPTRPTFLIVLTISLFSTSALSNRSVSYTDYCALCKVLSYAPTAPALPPGNPALSFYIPRSDCGLYYCSPLSVQTDIPSLSNFVLPCPFHKGLFLPRF